MGTPLFAGFRSCARRLLSGRSEEHTSELQSQSNLVCRLLLEKKKQHTPSHLAPAAAVLAPPAPDHRGPPLDAGRVGACDPGRHLLEIIGERNYRSGVQYAVVH